MTRQHDTDEPMTAAEFAAIGLTPGDASRYIDRFQIMPGHTYVLCSRVSGGERRANLDDQDRNLRYQVTSRGGIAISDEFTRHVGSGWYPSWLVHAVELAKPLKATLLAESTDRFVRNLRFHSIDRPDVRATDAELQELFCWADG